MTQSNRGYWRTFWSAQPAFRRLLVAILLLLGLVLSISVYLLARNYEQQRLQAGFRQRAFVVGELLRMQIANAEHTLYPLRTLYLFSESVERQEFNGAALDLLARNPAIQALEWVPRVTLAKRGEFEAKAKQDGLAGFQVIEPGPTAVRAGERAEYYPIYYVEPVKGNERLLGWDTLAGPNRAYMELARDTGKTVATGKLKIIQDIGGKSAWILIMPLYPGLSEPATVEQRRERLLGFIRVVFRIEDLIGGAFPASVLKTLDIVLQDKTPGEQPTILFQTSTNNASLPVDAELAKDLHERRTFQAASRQWELLILPNKAAREYQRGMLPVALAGAVMAIAALITLIFIYLLGHARTIEEQVAEQTSTLLITNQLLKEEVKERREAELASRESEERFRALADSAPVLIWMAEADLSMSYFNRTWLQFRGRELVQEANDGWREGVHPEDLPAWDKAMAEARQKEAPFHLEFRLKHHDGSYHWMFGTGAPRLKADNTFTGFIGTCLDITPLREAEAQRLKLERKLQETQKLESLGVVAGGIAHDFNNLLTAMLGHANLARMVLSPSSPLHEHLASIEKAALRAADLCKQMLAYAGKGRFNIERINLSQLVEDTTHLLQLAISKSAVLKFNLAPNLPPVDADASQMRQVIMNLVINASEAIGSRSGVISISTGMVRADRDYLDKIKFSSDLPEGEYVFLEVSDTGCGMDSETMSKIFDPFFTTKFTGRGLGLAAVLGIIRSHRGAIKVYSEPGKGSTFKILLPVANGAKIPKQPAEKTSFDFKGQGTVLVIEDEETVRAIICRTLESIGYSVVQAENGLVGVEKFTKATSPFQFVLLDLTMPHMDGEAAFRELRRLKPDVRVILMSGYNEQDAISQFAGKGLAGFLQKPFKLEELRQLLKKLSAGA